jgi:DNA/RNA endonuclease G (NUC1)
MQLGNPSNAGADTNNHAHYLIQRTVEALDYSDKLGEPVWASWDLTAGDVGSATRSTTYYTDIQAHGRVDAFGVRLEIAAVFAG